MGEKKKKRKKIALSCDTSLSLLSSLKKQKKKEKEKRHVRVAGTSTFLPSALAEYTNLSLSSPTPHAKAKKRTAVTLEEMDLFGEFRAASFYSIEQTVVMVVMVGRVPVTVLGVTVICDIIV